jgi:serine/threonine-protein kinase
MASCIECGAENEIEARFCSSCGQPTSSVSEFATVMHPNRSAAAPVRAETPPPSSQPTVSRFAPGTVLDSRYRIVALLGKGGMGEVYRADDLKLGNTVALKFLPPALERDIGLLDRFHAEVRNARQIAHPNVCRVYDIGEIDGRHFFTMEYIDGEDLASLLRRIGRLPHDKAVELGHQLCAGLAAAHDNGLLHRDLKPANIMIDGRGRARITDFGLALRADEAGSVKEFAGTPAYMAPEQLSGGSASVRSDIYALGLILYEMFTGKRPFEGESRADWTRLHLEHTPRIPSTVIDVSPAVERAILRCLSKDPAMRPASALQVSAALPGGDPLAAAMAAGETPSPEMVAAAGRESGITVKHASALLLGVLLLLGLLIPLAKRSMLLGVAPMTKSPDVLTDRAQTIAQHLGYTGPAVDVAIRTDASSLYLDYRSVNDSAPAWLHELAGASPGPYRFTYRQSPTSMSPRNLIGIVTADDPPMDTPGMLLVITDNDGKLIQFRAAPPQFDDAQKEVAAPDWGALFREAGLDIANFAPATPVVVPPMAFDARQAWSGKYGKYPVTVEAAAFQGKPVFFDFTFPWSPRRGEKGAGGRRQTGDLASAIVAILFLFLLPAVAIVMARRNMRSGRGDTLGASRVAGFALAVYATRQLLTLHYSSGAGMVNTMISTVGISLFLAGATWASYMAVEPLVRRQSPHLAISWARLISGRFTDALVGRDILIGVGAGMIICMIDRIPRALAWWTHVQGIRPESPLSESVSGTSAFIGQFFNGAWNALFTALIFLFIVTLARAIFKWRWAGALALFLVLAFLDGIQMTNPVLQITSVILGNAVVALLMVRVGPVAVAAAMASQMLVSNGPFAINLSTWYAGRSVLTIGVIVGLALFGFRNALAGRSLSRAFEAQEENSVVVPAG